MTIIQNTIVPKYVIQDNCKNKITDNPLVKEAAGITLGAGSAYFIAKGSNIPLKSYYNKLRSATDQFHSSNSNVMIQEAERMVKESGIASKGFRGITIYDVSSEAKIRQAIDHYQKTTTTILNNSSIINKIKLSALVILNKFAQIPNLLIGKLPNTKSNVKNLVQHGGFHPFTNSVFGGSTSSLLHEVGHAINKNKNFFTRASSRLSLISSAVLIPLAILTAMFHKKKQVIPIVKSD